MVIEVSAQVIVSKSGPGPIYKYTLDDEFRVKEIQQLDETMSTISLVKKDSIHVYFYSSLGEVGILNISTNEIKYISIPDYWEERDAPPYEEQIFITKKGRVYFVKNNILYSFEIGNNKSKKLFPINFIIEDMIEYKDKVVLVGGKGDRFKREGHILIFKAKKVISHMTIPDTGMRVDFSEDNEEVYVSCAGGDMGGDIYVLDMKKPTSPSFYVIQLKNRFGFGYKMCYNAYDNKLYFLLLKDIRIWDLSTHEEEDRQSIPKIQSTSSGAYIPDGNSRYLYIVGKHGIDIFDVVTKKIINTIESRIEGDMIVFP